MTEIIWNKFHERLLNFILSRVNEKSEAEDILQEVFIKIHRKKDSLKEAVKMESWIYQICRNTIIDYYRKRETEAERIRHFQERWWDEASEEEAIQLCLSPFVQQLSPSYKSVLENTILKQTTLKSYADTHSISYVAAKSRSQRAKKELKKLFLACCDIRADKYGNILSVKERNCLC